MTRRSTTLCRWRGKNSEQSVHNDFTAQKCNRTWNFSEILPSVGVKLGAVCCSGVIETESAVE